MRCALLLPVFVAAGVPAAAQQLRYQDVLTAEHDIGPTLTYVFLADTPPDETQEPERVRAFYGDRFEWRPQGGADAYNWDASAEIGGRSHRLWLATAGDGVFGGPLEFLETQALYSRPIAGTALAWQAGYRQDFVPRPRRSYAALGIQGNFTDAFYGGAFGFLSHKGELTARLFGYYDLPLLPDRLFLQPSIEAEIAAADVPALGIGAGPVYLEAGLRLRYRIDDRFAPYLGVNWERLLGRTARLARAEGEGVEALNLVIGLRSYFE
jgi:copper resistance protein B